MTAAIRDALRQAHQRLLAEEMRVRGLLVAAQSDHERVSQELADFQRRLPDLCTAAGLTAANITEGENGGDDRASVTQIGSASPTRPRSPDTSHLAVPFGQGTQRWFAAQALNELGREATISVVASKMRDMGYRHEHDPARPKQLEQSLAALPNQTSWFGRGTAPGTLTLCVPGATST